MNSRGVVLREFNKILSRFFEQRLAGSVREETVDQLENLIRTLSTAQFLRDVLFDELGWESVYQDYLDPRGTRARFDQKLTEILEMIVARDEPGASYMDINFDRLLEVSCEAYDMIR